MLVRAFYDEGTGKREMVPELATSWEPNGKQIILKLRQGVKFTDGSAFNATVARWNLDRARNHKKSAVKAFMETIDTVDVVDDYTIRLNLKAPSAATIPMLTIAPWIGSQEAEAKLGEDGYAKTPVGSGPFKLKERMPGALLTIRRSARRRTRMPSALCSKRRCASRALSPRRTLPLRSTLEAGRPAGIWNAP